MSERSGAVYRIDIPASHVDEIKTRVSFESDADIAVFVADAMRVYADLGAITQQPGMLMWHPADGGTPRRVRLPGGHGNDTEQ